MALGGSSAILDDEIVRQLKALPGSRKRNLFEDVTEMFDRDSPANVDALERALEREDDRELTFVAHRLVGTCGTLGDLEMQSLALGLEREASSSQWNNCREIMDKLILAMSRLTERLGIPI